MNWKGLLGGIALIVLIATAGFFYRSIKEHPVGQVACTTDAKICPDGTGLGRTGPLCTFPICPPPNIEIADSQLAFALPAGYEIATVPDESVVAAYSKVEESGAQSFIYIRKFNLGTSTAADFIRSNAIMDPSGLPASPTAFSSIMLGSAMQGKRQFSVVNLGQFEGVVNTTYYLARKNDILRFDAQSRNVSNWTDPKLDISKLQAAQDMRALLSTLQGT
jgi:hypothetical protein